MDPNHPPAHSTRRHWVLIGALGLGVATSAAFGWFFWPRSNDRDVAAHQTITPPHADPMPVPPAPPPPVVDWAACDAALQKAATESIGLRPKTVLAGCPVCGDWSPILRWATLEAEGGPRRAAIEAAMARCGYCNANAKQRFLGGLDKARGTSTRTPWRLLGESCQAEVSATPDNRFTSAPFYALDRIARAGFSRGGSSASLLGTVVLPLPAVSITGIGLALAEVPKGVQPSAGPIAISLIGGAIHAARLPRARMTANGLSVEYANYPGAEVALPRLPELLRTLVGDDRNTPIALLAPSAMPAIRIVPVVASASAVAPIYLAANAPGAPHGWQLPGTLQVELSTTRGTPYTVTRDLTIQNLANDLAGRAEIKTKALRLVVGK